MAQNQLKSGKLDSKRFISPNDPLNSNVFEATEVLGQSETINEQRYNQFVDDRLHGQNPFQKIKPYSENLSNDEFVKSVKSFHIEKND